MLALEEIMRTTITVEDTLFAEAQRITRVKRPSELFNLSLEALIRQESAKRLSALGGSIPEFKTPPRNR